MRKKVVNLYPGSKMAVLLSIVASGLVVNQTKIYLILIFLFVLIATAYGIIKEYLFSLTKIILLLTSIMFLLIVLTTPGESLLYQIGFLTIYDEGMIKATKMISRVVLVCGGILLIYKINSIEEISMVLEKLGVSTLGVFVIQSTITMVSQVKEKLAVIMDAQASRGMDFSGNIFQRTKKMIPLLFPLILSSFYDTEERTLVLVAKGIEIEGKKQRLYDKQRGNFDTLLIVMAGFLFILAVYWRVNYV